MAAGALPAQCMADRFPAAVRQTQIHQRRVEGRFFNLFQRGGHTGRCRDLPSLPLKQLFQRQHDGRLILHQKNPHRLPHLFSVCFIISKNCPFRVTDPSLSRISAAQKSGAGLRCLQTGARRFSLIQPARA